jgi:GTP cyclohydrolase I
MDDFDFPFRVAGRGKPEGVPTVGKISVHARINQEFEARWIDRFARVLHQHRDAVGSRSLRKGIVDYLEALHADSVQVSLSYPYFVEKKTPISKLPCLVGHNCTYRAKLTALGGEPKLSLKVEVPTLTTDPCSSPDQPGFLFAQRTLVTVEVASNDSLFIEDIVEAIDRHALIPVYSFLTAEDKEHLVGLAHSRTVSSVVLTEAIKDFLAPREDVDWYRVVCRNRGLLHLYATEVSTEKGSWVPASDFADAID